MNNAAIEINNVTKVYRGKKAKKIVALDGLSLDILPGQVFGLLGPNGAGKSTTIKILTGQIRPSHGFAKIGGISTAQASSRVKLGYLPENPSFYDFLTAREYLCFVGKAFSMPAGKIKAESNRVLEELDLSDAGDRSIRKYSKGMVQRLGLAQTMLHDPDIYIFDEPMSGLDPIGRALVKELMLDLKKRGKTVIFSTHITNDVETICDSFAILHKGILLITSSVKDVESQFETNTYRIYLKNSHGEDVETVCNKNELNPTIQKLLAEGNFIDQVVLQRPTLEDFFLDQIKGCSDVS